MVKLKNYNVVLKQFVLLLTFAIIISCKSNTYYTSKIEGKKISIENIDSINIASNKEIENYIKPYRENIDKNLNKVLSYNPEILDKSKGKWQTNIGNFIADITLLKSNSIFLKRENKSIDICLLNHGGIRALIPKGNVTARNAYEVMPFENTANVVALKSDKIVELVNYIISEKKPHPLSGLTFLIDKNNNAKNIAINNLPLNDSKTYYVVTSDYLINGGDNMTFFKDATRYDLDYKLRNIIIDYFNENDTLKINHDIRIETE